MPPAFLTAAAQVVDAFLKLNKGYQLAIADVTKRRGAGMAEFISKEARRRASVAQWA